MKIQIVLSCGLLLFASLQLAGCKAYLEALQNAQSAPKQAETPVDCPDVELLGLSDKGLLDAHVYCAKIRNKASYTKSVTVEWVDMYGQTKNSSFNVPAGQIIEGRLSANNGIERKPQNLRISACY